MRSGHAAIVRLIDGSNGFRPGNESLTDRDDEWSASYREQLEQAAQQFH